VPPSTSKCTDCTGGREDGLVGGLDRIASRRASGYVNLLKALHGRNVTFEWVKGLRASAEQLDALLHPKYALHDARGRVWGKGRAIAGMARPLTEEPELEVVAVEELAPWVVLLRYRERTPDHVLLCAATWIKNGDTWRLRFEQRTPILP